MMNANFARRELITILSIDGGGIKGIIPGTVLAFLESKLQVETLTNVVIPAFDIKILQPVIFNTHDAKVNALKNPRLADVCLATSAAPIFLPVHFFETKDDVANTTRTYDLIDGAIAINNPTLKFDYHVSTLFRSPNLHQNYLRIQDDSLTGDTASVDIATPQNLIKLVKIGEELIKKPVSRVNLETGRYETVDGEGSNEEALTKFAKLLHQERKLRLSG
ncbi:patatin-like protein 1 [Cucurbita pepo subsp. pepo]|uniref:patatin-like protein 1 n=1 Tax=Cucurbita pepo subsp. pepo TaxID=3664 RepID=UPI000C9D9A17|nr:patatin-like protein 1 [Cucurbita pepo subsp. pepo]